MGSIEVKKIDKDNIRRILVVRTDRMGDVLLNIPAIRALKETFQAFIVALVDPAVEELLLGSAEIDQVMTFHENSWNKSLSRRLSFLRILRQGRFDLAVILNPSKRFHLLTFLAGIPRRVGYNRKWGFLLTHRIEDKKSCGQKHEVEYNLDLVRRIGADTNDQHISLKLAEKDIGFVNTLLSKQGIEAQDLIVVMHAHSSNPAKCWPKERFVAVAEQIYARFRAKVVIIGGAQERASAIKLISLAKYPLINLAGKLTLRQLTALLQRSALLISNDSGPVHIAAAVGTCAIVIFGRNIPGVGPQRWGPWGAQHIVLHKDPGCSPCLDRNCPYDFKCLTSITPEDVLEAVENKKIASR